MVTNQHQVRDMLYWRMVNGAQNERFITTHYEMLRAIVPNTVLERIVHTSFFLKTISFRIYVAIRRN